MANNMKLKKGSKAAREYMAKIRAKRKNVGAIKIVEKGESKSAKASATYLQKRSAKGTFKGLKRINGTNDRETGYIGNAIVKKYTLAELKYLNPIYFEKGKDKFHGVLKRKMIVSPYLKSQFMIEKQKMPYGDISYTARKISNDGEISLPERFTNLYNLSLYIGKKISI
jgi:hypothetical protein